MLRHPGSSSGFGALLNDTSVMVLEEDTPPTNNPCRTWDSNPKPSAYKSDSLSIRPRLPLLILISVCRTVVNTTAFFFREGVWHHGLFVSRWNVKEHDTHVSRKSCIIQQIRGRLRNSWRVSTFVFHMHQTFSQRSRGVTSEAGLVNP